MKDKLSNRVIRIELNDNAAIAISLLGFTLMLTVFAAFGASP
jgi:hypothetical protein